MDDIEGAVGVMLESGTDGPFQLLSVAPAEPIDDLEAAAGLFEGLAARAAELNLKPVIERIYANPRALPALRVARTAALDAYGVRLASEPTWVCNPLIGDGLLDTIQILGVSLEHDWTWKHLDLNGNGSGSLVTGPELEVCGLSDMCGGVGLSAQDALNGMFDGSDASLQEHGFSYRDVARTWFYVADLLDWYGELNQVRDDLFARSRVGGTATPPASTCLQGFHPAGAPCFMELLAVKSSSSERPFRALKPLRQCEAWDYGSNFSRGMVVDFLEQQLVTVSGTSSIDTAGQTAHANDARGQILATMANVEHLLSLEGLSLESTVWQSLYFKDVSTFECWHGLENEGLVPKLHGPRLVADSCRDDLLFAMEATVLY